MATQLSHRLIGFVVIVVTAVIGVIPANTASAATGYSVSSTTVYRVGDDGNITGTTDYNVTNTRPNKPGTGGSYTYFYLTSFNAPLDKAATNVAVTVNGKAATFETTDTKGYPVAKIDYGYRLRYNETANVNVTWDVAGSTPRDPDSFVRSSPAYVAFPVYGWADDGKATVSIELDASWSYDYVGADLTVEDRNGTTVLTARNIDKPLEWAVGFTAGRTDRYTSTEVTLDAGKFTILSWPNDPEWQQYAEESITKGVPALEKAVAMPWPNEHTEVLETTSPYLRGYAGFYSSFDEKIQAGEDLDRQVMLHELTHAWFNSSTVRTRWLSEGITEQIAAQVAREVWDDDSGLTTVADLDEQGLEYTKFSLNDWGQPLGDDDPRENYGYAKSYEVVRDLAAEIGDEKMTELAAAIIKGHRAYPGADGPDTDPDSVDWREFLDLAEQAGSTKLAEQYVMFVMNETERPLLEARATQLNAYNALRAAGGDWVPPAGVRHAMADWNFDAAGTRMTTATDALAIKEKIVATLAPAKLIPSLSTKAVYQDATGDLEGLAATMQAHLDASTSIANNTQQLAEQLPQMGFSSLAMDPQQYDEDIITTAERMSALAKQADKISAEYTKMAASVERFGGTAPKIAADSFTKNPDELAVTIDKLTVAAQRVEAAHTASKNASSVFERIGAFGSSADSLLAAASTKLTNGDTEGAVADADAAITQIDAFAAAGKTRAGIGGAILAGFLLLGSGAVVTRRRKRSAVATPDSAPVDAFAPPTPDQATEPGRADLPPPNLSAPSTPTEPDAPHPD